MPLTQRVSAVLARTGVRHMGHVEPSAKLTTNTYRMIVVATLTGFVTAFTWKAWHNGQKKLYDDFYATKK
ncbi:hypothetical protein KFE25_002346 [Diacronema lutheri]|uniref:Uncharacterized protein n=1 Tax=Diacronema lutheri TaxID=2081491 RepID=A0A8J5XCM2_DIALT|nr:hypothetical protein KFE25_002346 [Diacronema lutheri]